MLFDRPKPTAGCSANGRRRSQLLRIRNVVDTRINEYGMKMDGVDTGNRRNTCLCATLSTTNPTAGCISRVILTYLQEAVGLPSLKPGVEVSVVNQTDTVDVRT
jgi:hypothetical protein